MRRLFVFRPQPAAHRTVERAQKLGLDAVAIPLFDLEAVEWSAPDPAQFDAYEAAVRREYAWVDDPAWRSGRATVLKRFLDLPAIFKTDTFRRLFEAAARDNIARSLATLAEPARRSR